MSTPVKYFIEDIDLFTSSPENLENYQDYPRHHAKDTEVCNMSTNIPKLSRGKRVSLHCKVLHVGCCVVLRGG